MMNFDTKQLSADTVSAVKNEIKHFNIQEAKKTSMACASLLEWVWEVIEEYEADQRDEKQVGGSQPLGGQQMVSQQNIEVPMPADSS